MPREVNADETSLKEALQGEDQEAWKGQKMRSQNSLKNVMLRNS